MENGTIRYSGPPTTLYSYTKEFLVECPKCQNWAVITTNRSFDTSNDKLICYSCNHIEMADERIRYNATVKRSCDNCGKLVNIIIPNNKDKIEELTIPCSHCGIVRTYKSRNDSYKLLYENSGIGDPIFNLPLWFQADIKGNLFWAFNREHLAEIRNYVSAKLRERQTMTHSTMVERLPNFIKVAKNRDTVLKAIEKMMRK